MGIKHICIIGGGISGLAVLHFLNKRFRDTVQITLYERDSIPGGTIRSVKNDSCLFEWGPNGFLDNQPDTLKLIDELQLNSQLIEAQQSASRRYIQINRKLVPVPLNPTQFLTTPLVSIGDKCSLIKGLFKKNISKDNSIYNYVAQRFSSNIAESLIDPFISGIYAGNIKRLHMEAAFPKFKRTPKRKTQMRTFKGGMGQIIETLYNKYKNQIIISSEISSVPTDVNATILATPAYAAAKITENLNPKLSALLDQIPYVPVAVVGLLFKTDSFKTRPDGFGYLIPSKENKDILGVLVESNVYENRAEADHILLRVMLGGAHHPGILNDSIDQILVKATKEIDATYGLLSNPIDSFYKLWPKAIPQYEINYPALRQSIAQECSRTPGLYLCANYLDGISFNDCIHHAQLLAERLTI